MNYTFHNWSQYTAAGNYKLLGVKGPKQNVLNACWTNKKKVITDNLLNFRIIESNHKLSLIQSSETVYKPQRLLVTIQKSENSSNNRGKKMNFLSLGMYTIFKKQKQ